jgi:hypothetical protein
MGVLTREQILGAPRKTTRVDLPELGGEVFVRQMSARERIEFLQRAGDDRDTTGAWLVSRLTVDADGNALFTEKDIEALQDRPFGVIDRIAEAVLKLNGLHRDSAEAAAGN